MELNLGNVADIVTVLTAAGALVKVFYLNNKVDTLEQKIEKIANVSGDGNQTIQGNDNKDNNFTQN